jgi:hypothetical protein
MGAHGHTGPPPQHGGMQQLGGMHPPGGAMQPFAGGGGMPMAYGGPGPQQPINLPAHYGGGAGGWLSAPGTAGFNPGPNQFGMRPALRPPVPKSTAQDYSQHFVQTGAAGAGSGERPQNFLSGEGRGPV